MVNLDGACWLSMMAIMLVCMLSGICFIALSVDSVSEPEQLQINLWIARPVFAYTTVIDVEKSPKAAADPVTNTNSSVKTTACALQE